MRFLAPSTALMSKEKLVPVVTPGTGMTVTKPGVMLLEPPPPQPLRITLARNAAPREEQAMRILVVEDDSLLAQGLTRVLARAGHAVDRAETGVQADQALRAASYDLVVLDIGLPDIDGFEVLRRLRLRHAAVNVLVLTARDAIEDRVHGLDLGADDYLTKPFSVTEFEARIRAMLRRGVEPAT